MNLLRYVHDREEHARIKHLLDSNGIPTFDVVAGSGHRLPYRVGIFACINRQHKDALLLLSNPDHAVKDPVDVKEFYSNAENMSHSTILQLSFYTLLVVLIVFFSVLVLFHRFG